MGYGYTRTKKNTSFALHFRNVRYRTLLLTTHASILSAADDKDDKQDIRILNELENIDDELDKEGIVIVRIDNDAEAKEYGIDHLPTLVYFENKIPALYEGRLGTRTYRVAS